MNEIRSPEPDAAGAVRGALLIVAIGVALGVAYNAVGLASRPRHGIAWVKTTPKLASLESLQAEAAKSAPAPGTAIAAPAPPVQAGTGSVTAQPATPPAAGKGTGKPAAPGATASKPPHRTPPAPASGAESGATPAPRAGAAAPGAPAAPPAPAQASEPPAANPPPPAADLPVIPDVPGPIKVEIATLKKLYDANAVLVVDAREAPEYAEGHIRGAVSLPYNDAMAEPERVQKLDPEGRPIAIYCSGGTCELSIDLARVLIEGGKRRVLVYEGGYPEWAGAGHPVAKGPNP